VSPARSAPGGLSGEPLAGGYLRDMPRRPGLVLVAHRYDAESTAHVHALVSGVGIPGRLAAVGTGAYDDVGAAVDALTRERCDAVTLVPLMTCSESRLVRDVAALAPSLAADHGIAVALAAALDDAPEAIEVLCDRATTLADDVARQAVMLVGHGPERDEDVPAWEQLGMTIANGVRGRGRFSAVRSGVVRDDAPAPVRAAAVRAVRERIARFASDTGHPVIVVPWLVGAGRLARSQLLQDLAELEIRYEGTPMLPHPALGDWLARELAVASMVLTRARPGTVVSLWER
jgi:sirohydrochlorin ferrochelatase